MKHTRLLQYIDEIARLGSIRAAAIRLNVTPSALNRRIQDLEFELGVPLFERLPRGVRLNAAGELFVRHVRSQMADLDRVQSQIQDLAGLRRGRVSIACSQAVANAFLPREIARYQEEFPLVNFSVQVRDHNQAMQAMMDYSADLILVFSNVAPQAPQGVLNHFVSSQPLVAIAASGHPVFAESGPVRLRDCFNYPLVLPTRDFGGRALLDQALSRTSQKPRVMLETNSFELMRAYCLSEPVIMFQVAIGAADIMADTSSYAFREVDRRDVPAGFLSLSQLKERTLPVASAKFAQQLATSIRQLPGAELLD